VISIDANFIVFPKVLILGAAIVMQGTQVKNCFYYSIGFCHTGITSFKTRLIKQVIVDSNSMSPITTPVRAHISITLCLLFLTRFKSFFHKADLQVLMQN
jgi:hypothetical protein